MSTGKAEDGKTGSADWPLTVADAVAKILAETSELDKAMLRLTKEADLIRYHFGWGMGIRNSFGLWRGNNALLADCKAKHPDDASMVIIKAVRQRVQTQ